MKHIKQYNEKYDFSQGERVSTSYKGIRNLLAEYSLFIKNKGIPDDKQLKNIVEVFLNNSDVYNSTRNGEYS